jgi:hypothetical protein
LLFSSVSAAINFYQLKTPRYNLTVSSNQDDGILGLPRRPRIAEASAGAILGAIALGLLTEG